MDHSLLVAAIAGLGGMFGWGLADFFAKKTIDRIGDIVSLVWAHVAGALVVVLSLIAILALRGNETGLPTTASGWSGLAFFGALQAAVYLFAYVGFGKGQVAVLNPIFASYSGVVALISVVFLGEALSGLRALALLVVFIGILLVSVDVGALRTKNFRLATAPGFREIAVAAALAAVWTLGWNRFVRGHEGVAYACAMYLFMTFTLLLYAAVRRVSLKFTVPNVWPYLALIGLCEVGAYAAITLGYASTSHTSVVALLSGAFSMPTVILARIFLRERTTATQTLGSAILVAGIAALPVL